MYTLLLVACTASPSDVLEIETLDAPVEAAAKEADATTAARGSRVGEVTDRLPELKAYLLAEASEEPCGIRGVLGGTYTSDADGAGTFSARGFGRDRELVAEAEGDYLADGSGGVFAGDYDAVDADDGALEGEYAEQVEGEDFGTFTGAWTPSDGASGTLTGAWQPVREGVGFVVGYWTVCEG